MKNNKKENKALLIALAVCVFSIGVAAWGTYSGISEYLNMEGSVAEGLIYNSQENQSQAPNIINNETDTNVKDIDPEKAEFEQKPNEEAVSEPSDVIEEVTVEVEPKPVPQTQPEPEPEPIAEEVAAPTYTLSSNFTLPVNSSTILKEFSANELVYNETMKDYRVHNGVDVKAVMGETVFAVNNGLVKKGFNDLLLGNVIIIEHGDYEVWYCGLGDTFLVNEGDIVHSGQEIGSVKDVPFEQGETHLHIEVWLNGEAVDPFSLILP